MKIKSGLQWDKYFWPIFLPKWKAVYSETSDREQRLWRAVNDLDGWSSLLLPTQTQNISRAQNYNWGAIQWVFLVFYADTFWGTSPMLFYRHGHGRNQRSLFDKMWILVLCFWGWRKGGLQASLAEVARHDIDRSPLQNFTHFPPCPWALSSLLTSLLASWIPANGQDTYPFFYPVKIINSQI